MKIFDFPIILVTFVLYVTLGHSTTSESLHPEPQSIECSPKLSWFEAIFLFPLSLEACRIQWGRYDLVGHDVREDNLDPGALYAKEEDEAFSLNVPANEFFTWLAHLDEVVWQYLLQWKDDIQLFIKPPKVEFYRLPSAATAISYFKRLREIASLRMSEAYFILLTVDGLSVLMTVTLMATVLLIRSLVGLVRGRKTGHSKGAIQDILSQTADQSGQINEGDGRVTCSKHVDTPDTIKHGLIDNQQVELSEVKMNLSPILEESVDNSNVQRKADLECNVNTQMVGDGDNTAKIIPDPDTEKSGSPTQEVQVSQSNPVADTPEKVELSDGVLDMLMCVRANCHHVHHVQDALSKKVEKIGMLQDKILDNFTSQKSPFTSQKSPNFTSEKSPRGSLPEPELHLGPQTFPYEGPCSSSQQSPCKNSLAFKGTTFLKDTLGTSTVSTPFQVEQLEHKLSLDQDRKRLLDLSLDSDIGAPCANSSFREDQGDIDREWQRYDPQNLLQQFQEMERRLAMYQGLLGKPARPCLPTGLDTDSSYTEETSLECSSRMDISELNDSMVYYGQDRSISSLALLYTFGGLFNKIRSFFSHSGDRNNQNSSRSSQHSGGHNRSRSLSRSFSKKFESSLNSITNLLDLIE